MSERTISTVSEQTPESAAPPVLRVVRGEPSPEELAALVAVLAARGGGEPEREPARSPWGRPHPGARSLAVHPSAWRESGWTPGLRTRADW